MSKLSTEEICTQLYDENSSVLSIEHRSPKSESFERDNFETLILEHDGSMTKSEVLSTISGTGWNIHKSQETSFELRKR